MNHCYRIERSGAEYRGRARQTIWDGSLTVKGTTIVSAHPINFLNPDRPLKKVSDTAISWSSITTGNYAGVDIVLSGSDGDIEISTPPGTVHAALSTIGHSPRIDEFGKLARQLRISRQPEAYSRHDFIFTRKVELIDGDNPLWVCANFADGHQAWSSPIYLIAAT